MEISIGICAYNEEKNIGNLLKFLTINKEDGFKIVDIVVVSESNDATNDIVDSWMKKNNKIILIEKKQRTGKACAIDEFIKSSKCDILVLIDVDIMLRDDTIKNLISPFIDKKVGMTGGKRLPIIKKYSFAWFAEDCLCKTIDYFNSINTEKKINAPIAFRKQYVKNIPYDISSDESYIQLQIQKNGLNAVYVSNAIIHYKGPDKISDFIMQRRRIAAAHYDLRSRFDYTVPTNRPIKLLKIIPCLLKDTEYRFYIWLFGAVMLEIYCRILGFYDFKICKKKPFKWDIAQTTKEVIIYEW